jgi:hypothetical protein
MHRISVIRSLYFKMFSASWSHFCFQKLQHLLTCMFLFYFADFDVQFIVRNSSVVSHCWFHIMVTLSSWLVLTDFGYMVILKFVVWFYPCSPFYYCLYYYYYYFIILLAMTVFLPMPHLCCYSVTLYTVCNQSRFGVKISDWANRKWVIKLVI